MVHSAWLTAHLITVGHHIPKDFPRSPSALLKKSDSPKKPNLQTPEQVAAVFSSLLGSRVEVDAPKD